MKLAECRFSAKDRLPRKQLSACFSAPECRHEKASAAHLSSCAMSRFELNDRCANGLRGCVWSAGCADGHVFRFANDDHSRCERDLVMDLCQYCIGHDRQRYRGSRADWDQKCSSHSNHNLHDYREWSRVDWDSQCARHGHCDTSWNTHGHNKRSSHLDYCRTVEHAYRGGHKFEQGGDYR
jgi:hypothetical protein